MLRCASIGLALALLAGPAAAQTAGAKATAAPVASSAPATSAPATSAPATSAPGTSAKPMDARAQSVSTGPQAAPNPGALRALFDKGVAAHDQGRLKVARDLFEQAWALKRSWDIAANLGIVEQELGSSVEAAEHLAFARDALPPSESEDTRKGLDRELAKAAGKVATITVRAAIAGAEVRIAGEVKGVTPLAGPLFAAPGSTLVELRMDGYEAASQRIEAKAGEARAVSFVLRPSAPKRSIAWGPPAVAFGFGGAGLLTAAVAGTIAAVKLADLRMSCGAALVCPASSRGDAEDGRSAADFATAGLALAGAGLAVGILWIVVPTRTTTARAGLSVGPGIVSLKGAF